MSGMTETILAAVNQEVYRNGGRFTQLLYSPNKIHSPIFASMTEKTENDFGRGHVVKLQTLRGDSVAPDLTIAEARAASGDAGAHMGFERMVVTAPVKDLEGICRFERRALDDAIEKQQPSEVRKLITTQIDNTSEYMRLALMFASAGRGYGRVSTIISVSTTSVVIAGTDSPRIQRRTQLVAGATEVSGTLRDSGTAATVTGKVENIPANTTTLTMSANVGSAGWAAGDSLFLYGYRHDNASPELRMPVGLGTLLPFADATDTVWGLARTGRNDLYGYPVNCGGGNYATIASALQSVGNFAAYRGHVWDFIAIAPDSYTALLDSKEKTKIVELSTKIGPYNIGFDGAAITVASGKKIPIISDVTLDSGQFRAGPWNDKELGCYHVRSSGLKIINIDDHAGMMIPSMDSSDVKVRLYSRLQFVCPAPMFYTSGYGLPSI